MTTQPPEYAEKAAPPPAFAYEGGWPFTGTPTVAGHPLASVTGFTVDAGSDSIPVVTLRLVDRDALRIMFDHAAVRVGDETREALVALGWTPPASH